MGDTYILFHNESKTAEDMGKFFKKNGVKYITVHKSQDSSARVFPPNYESVYEEGDFRDLRSRILSEILD
jgi:hypothetical protein